MLREMWFRSHCCRWFESVSLRIEVDVWQIWFRSFRRNSLLDRKLRGCIFVFAIDPNLGIPNVEHIVSTAVRRRSSFNPFSSSFRLEVVSPRRSMVGAL